MKKSKRTFAFLLVFLTVTIGVIGITGCIKQSHEVRFTNLSSNPYMIEIDGRSNVISGNSYKNYYLDRGTYPWQVTQQSGYLLYPTVRSGTISVNKDKQIVFP